MGENFKIDAKEEECLELARQFIRENADKYSLRSIVDAPTDAGVAANTLLGNIAHDKYKKCVSSPDKFPEKSR